MQVETKNSTRFITVCVLSPAGACLTQACLAPCAVARGYGKICGSVCVRRCEADLVEIKGRGIYCPLLDNVVSSEVTHCTYQRHSTSGLLSNLGELSESQAVEVARCKQLVCEGETLAARTVVLDVIDKLGWVVRRDGFD